MTDGKDEFDYESPCIRNCVVDEVSGYCRGCGRTLREISHWTRYSQEERRRILATLPARRIEITPNV